MTCGEPTDEKPPESIGCCCYCGRPACKWECLQAHEARCLRQTEVSPRDTEKDKISSDTEKDKISSGIENKLNHADAWEIFVEANREETNEHSLEDKQWENRLLAKNVLRHIPCADSYGFYMLTLQSPMCSAFFLPGRVRR